MPVRYQTRAEIIVERVAIPADVRRGQPFDLRVVITNTAVPRPGDAGEVRGRLQLARTAGGRTDILSDEAVILPPGKKVFTIRQEIDQPNFYSYEARFTPDRAEDDAMPQNNRATALLMCRAKAGCCSSKTPIGPANSPSWSSGCGKQGLEIDVQSTSQLFTSLAELQPYDSVVLADVPRATSQDVAFSDAQIAMLVRNTQQMGAGLVMLGGRNSFGAGGWTGTEMEKAMPVDFQIKSAKVVPRGALGHDHARQRNGRRQLLAKGDCPRGDQGPGPARLLRRDTLGRQEKLAVGERLLQVGSIATRCLPASTA